MTEIQKFDPSQLMQGVRDRIKATFVSLIPDAQWEQLCQKEIDEFFNPKREYGNYKDISSFSKVCSEVLHDITKDQVQRALEKYESTIWNNNELVVNDLLKESLLKNASELFAAMVGSQVQRVILEMKNRGY